LLSVPVGEAALGRVVNTSGTLDGKGSKSSRKTFYPLEKIAPGVIKRRSVSHPVAERVSVAIDAMIPIGRGQRELIIGRSATGKTTIGYRYLSISQARLNKAGEVFTEPKTTDRSIAFTSPIGPEKFRIVARSVLACFGKRVRWRYTTIISAPASDQRDQSIFRPVRWFAAWASGSWKRNGFALSMTICRSTPSPIARSR